MTIEHEVQASSAITTAQGELFFKWFHDLYEHAFESISSASLVDNNLRLFDVRLNHTLSTDISLVPGFRHVDTDEQREAYKLMLRLSNIWFCYEALIRACHAHGLTKNSKSKVDVLKDDVINELAHEYELFKVILEFWGMNGDLVRDKIYREDMQNYVDHLRLEATSKEQKEYLLCVFNRFTNNDPFSVPEALSFAYAVRNQYVHSGDAPESGVTHLKTKIAALQFSFDYLVLFCLRTGQLLIERKLASI